MIFEGGGVPKVFTRKDPLLSDKNQHDPNSMLIGYMRSAQCTAVHTLMCKELRVCQAGEADPTDSPLMVMVGQLFIEGCESYLG